MVRIMGHRDDRNFFGFFNQRRHSNCDSHGLSECW